MHPAIAEGEEPNETCITTAIWDWSPIASWDSGKHWPSWQTPDDGAGMGYFGEGGGCFGVGKSKHVLCMVRRAAPRTPGRAEQRPAGCSRVRRPCPDSTTTTSRTRRVAARTCRVRRAAAARTPRAPRGPLRVPCARRGAGLVVPHGASVAGPEFSRKRGSRSEPSGMVYAPMVMGMPPWTALPDKAVECTGAADLGDIGVHSNYSCLSHADLGLQYRWRAIFARARFPCPRPST